LIWVGSEAKTLNDIYQCNIYTGQKEHLVNVPFTKD